MSDQLHEPAGVSEPTADASFLQNLFDLFVAPQEAFERICRKPSFVLPAVLLLIVSAAATFVWLHNVDAREFVQQQMEQFGGKFVENLTPEQRRDSLDMQTKMLPLGKWLGVALGTPLMLLIAAGVYWMIFRFFYAVQIRFAQSLAITAWSFLVVDLVGTALRLLVLWLKGVWEIEPRLAFQASPGAFVASSAPKWLWALASVPDLFTIWTIFLLATGFAVASRKSTGAAAWGVAIPWFCLALAGVAYMAVAM